MEMLIIDFWFPLEKYLMESLSALAQTVDDWLAGKWLAIKKKFYLICVLGLYLQLVNGPQTLSLMFLGAKSLPSVSVI